MSDDAVTMSMNVPHRYPWPAGKSPWAAVAADIAAAGGAAGTAGASQAEDKVALSDSPTVQLLLGIVSRCAGLGKGLVSGCKNTSPCIEGDNSDIRPSITLIIVDIKF